MTSKHEHRAEYERRLHRVLAHIDAHLDEPIDLARLARVANFSAFHFHRIFAAHVGETLGTYLTRRRVELAAARLASQPRLSVLNVALAVGFGSAEAFSRAFKKRFGCTPSQWKTEHPSERREPKESKLDQVVRSLGQEIRPPLGYDAGMVKTNTTPLQVAIRSRPSVRVAYLRYQGPFGEPVGRFWGETVYPWMVANSLLGAPRYGISHDDPLATATAKCRYDAGVEVGGDFVPSQGAQLTTLSAGKYACTKLKCTPAEIVRVWDRLLREWLPASGYQLDARPSYEYYAPDCECDPETGAFTCELCIPITKL